MKSIINHKIFNLIATVMIVGLLAVASGAQFTSGFAAGDQGPELLWRYTGEIKLKDGMTSHQLNNVPVDRGQFFNNSNELVRKVLGREKVKIQENLIDEYDGWHTWVDETHASSNIMQNASNGNISFCNKMTEFVTLENPKLPTDSEAQQLARKYLGEFNLLPADFGSNAKLLHVGGISEQTLQDGKPGPIMQKVRTLHFGRELNGIPIQGPGSKIVVQLGHEGAIVGLTKNWTALKPRVGVVDPNLKLKEFRIQDPLRIERQQNSNHREIRKIDPKILELAPSILLDPILKADEVKANIIREFKENWRTADSVEILDIEPVYYDRSGNWVQPAYAVQAKIKWENDELNYLFHTSALRNPPEPIYLPMRFETPKAFETEAEAQAKGLTGLDMQIEFD